MNISKFTAEEDEILIDLVRQNPSLYVVKSRSYKDAVGKNNIWKSISKYFANKSDCDCKGRWKSMRDYYQRKKREYFKDTSTGSAKEDQEDKFTAKFKNLRFLDATSMAERVTISSSHHVTDNETETPAELATNSLTEMEVSDNITPTDDTENLDTTQENFTRPLVTKHKDDTSVADVVSTSLSERPPIKKSENTSSDPAISMFFQSIATTVSTFPPLQKARIKAETMQMVARYEIEMLHSASSVCSQSAPLHDPVPPFSINEGDLTRDMIGPSSIVSHEFCEQSLTTL